MGAKGSCLDHELIINYRAGGTGGAGGAVAPQIFLKIVEKVAFSTPNISRLVLNAPQKFISTPNILHLPTGLGKMSSCALSAARWCAGECLFGIFCISKHNFISFKTLKRAKQSLTRALILRFTSRVIFYSIL